MRATLFKYIKKGESEMGKKEKYTLMAESIIRAVGGKGNIKMCFHCATRLRFVLKDLSVVDIKELEKVTGVIGTQTVGNQLQIIIGQQVAEIYDEVCDIADIKKETAIDEQVESTGKLNIKKIGTNVLDALSSCVVPLLPIIMSASFIKMFAMVLGPSMLNLVSVTSDLYLLLTFVGDAGFYFLPIYVAYTASKKFNCSPVMALFIAGIMLHPTLTSIVSNGEPFTVYGLPMKLVNYGSSSIPIVLIVWVQSYVEKFFKKYIPSVISLVFVPLSTLIVMLPIALCLIGPLGSELGNLITNGLLALSGLGVIASILVSALSGALWNIFVLTGMHLTVYFAFLNVFIEKGSESLIGPTIAAATIGVAGMTCASLVRLKGKNNKSLVTGYLISHVLGGVTEPSIFGLGIRYKKPFLGACIGGAVGSIYYAISGVAITTLSSMSNILIFTQFLGGTTGNIVNGFIGGGIAFIAAFLFTYFFGFTKEEIKLDGE